MSPVPPSLTALDRLKDELDRLIWPAAEKVASEPDRRDEARRNLDYLLGEIEGQAAIQGVTGRTVSDVLARLCPMFPFC